MSLSPASWLPLAAGLAEGEKRRVNHDCGAGRTLIIKRDSLGRHAFCFRCNDHGWMPPEPEPLAVRLSRLRKQDEADAKTAASVLLPEPRVYSWSEWPEEFRLWLLKAGLSAHDSGQLGVYYHPPTNRAVLPVLGPSGHPVFWQARALRGRLPKYLAPAVDKTTVLPVYGKATEVTLTEDILSAYKVGTVAEGWAMMGTSLSKHCLAKLINRGCKVNVWLDPDTAGRKAAKAVLATLRGAGLEARQIHSAKDPKLIHRQYIKEILS